MTHTHTQYLFRLEVLTAIRFLVSLLSTSRRRLSCRRESFKHVVRKFGHAQLNGISALNHAQLYCLVNNHIGLSVIRNVGHSLCAYVCKMMVLLLAVLAALPITGEFSVSQLNYRLPGVYRGWRSDSVSTAQLVIPYMILDHLFVS